MSNSSDLAITAVVFAAFDASYALYLFTIFSLYMMSYVAPYEAVKKAKQDEERAAKAVMGEYYVGSLHQWYWGFRVAIFIVSVTLMGIAMNNNSYPYQTGVLPDLASIQFSMLSAALGLNIATFLALIVGGWHVFFVWK